MLSIAPLAPDRPARQWDFSGYKHSNPPEEEPFAIYPALYRVDGTRFAVALVSRFAESYSGGGATFEMADFPILDEAGERGKYTVAYAGVPFACNKTVRACFSARDEKNSATCHDETSGYLTLSYSPAPASWSFFWHETERPAHASQKSASIPFDVSPAAQAYKLPPGVPFCGGGPADWPSGNE